jgi:hypothetical protein
MKAICADEMQNRPGREQKPTQMCNACDPTCTQKIIDGNNMSAQPSCAFPHKAIVPKQIDGEIDSPYFSPSLSQRRGHPKSDAKYHDKWQVKSSVLCHAGEEEDNIYHREQIQRRLTTSVMAESTFSGKREQEVC